MLFVYCLCFNKLNLLFPKRLFLSFHNRTWLLSIYTFYLWPCYLNLFVSIVYSNWSPDTIMHPSPPSSSSEPISIVFNFSLLSSAVFLSKLTFSLLYFISLPHFYPSFYSFSLSRLTTTNFLRFSDFFLPHSSP